VLDFESTIKAAARGDERAFSALYRAYNPMLVRYMRVVAGVSVCDDLAAETWVDVVRGLDRFEGDEVGFRGWIFTIGRRRHLDWRRKEGRRPQTVDDADLERLASVADIDPAEVLSAGIATQQALDLIATLSPDQADVVALRAIAGLDVAETAAVVGKSSGAVRVLAHRGLHRLATKLGADVPPLEV
jgi:RNA polymerase sigma-70 factor (ECF subfamily)